MFHSGNFHNGSDRMQARCFQRAQVGDPGAYGYLGHLYHTGDVVEKDERKTMHHLRLAAIGGVLSVEALDHCCRGRR